MEWQITPGKDHFVVRTNGSFSFASWQKMTEAVLNHQQWVPGTDVLFDHRELDLSQADFNTMFSAAKGHAEHDEHIGDGRAAIVFGSKRDYGLGRMFQNATEGEVKATLRIFDNLREAELWLAEPEHR